MAERRDTRILLKGAILLFDADKSEIQKIITFQYNPGTITRSLQPKGTGNEGGDHSEVLRLSGPPVETIKLDIEIDGTDRTSIDHNNGEKLINACIHKDLAALEMIIYPSHKQIQEQKNAVKSGSLVIIPLETSVPFFVWSENRSVPIRITEMSITEESFAPDLSPIRAKISLGFRVLTFDDLGYEHAATRRYESYLDKKEKLASEFQYGSENDIGIENF